MHILSVDDIPINQKLMTKFLSKYNCTVATASNGQEALSYLSNPANPPPDLIFMDVKMPVLDGASAAIIIRTQPPFANNPVLRATPIIAVGTHGVIMDPEAFVPGRGFDDSIPKPVQVSRVERVLSVWGRERGLPGSGVLPGATAGPWPVAAAIRAGAGAGAGGFRPWGGGIEGVGLRFDFGFGYVD